MAPIKLNIRHKLAAALLAWLSLNAAAFAQSSTDSFTLRISEKEMELAHTGDPDWERYNRRDLGFERMCNRNTPFLELTNNLDSPLTEFHLFIGDTRFNFTNDFFGHFAVLADSTAGFSISSSTLNNLGDELIVQIGNGGLKKTDGVLRFQIDLDVDPEFLADPYQFFPHPDYRTVLFDIADIDPYGPQDNQDPNDSSADNATFWAKYGTLMTEQEQMPDISLPGAYQGYYNENLRPYRLTDPVGLYVLAGGVAIPEPTSALLAICAFAVGGLCTSRRR